MEIRNQDLLDDVLTTVPDVIWSTTPDGTLLYLSKAAERIYGYPVAEFELRPIWEESVHPDDRPILAQGLQALAQLDCMEVIYRIIRSDGEIRWLHDRARAIHDHSGLIVRFDGIARDITESYHAERELRLASTVFEGCGEAILVTDAEGRIVSVNRSFTHITGYQECDVVGQNPRILSSGLQDETFYQQMWQSIHEKGRWQGEIKNRRSNGEIYSEWLTINAVRDADGHITHFVAMFSDLTERKSAEECIHYLTNHDALTGLANRNLLFNQIRQLMLGAGNSHRKVAVLMLDLDRFIRINESLGQSCGDYLLQHTAKVLRSCIRDTDLLGRQNGDDFLMVLSEIGSVEAVAQRSLLILERLAQPIEWQERQISLSASIGISVFPDDARDPDTLLKNAERALAEAKHCGRNTYHFFAQGMTTTTFEYIQMEGRLRRAIASGELSLHYQPQVDLQSGRIIGMEALLRWYNQEVGMTSPAQFIPLAEESGLIVPIGEWVIREACRQNRQWQEAGLPPLVVAVNLSALQFRRSNLLEVVEQSLAESRLESRYLELELTESILLHDIGYILDVICSLKKKGVMLSIDDFGTGYSSLAYLKNLPVDKLKIDRSFVMETPRHASDAAIVRTIVQMGHSLNLKVIAEGVENEQQWQFLRECQCDEIQGYFCSSPLPAGQIANFLREWRGCPL